MLRRTKFFRPAVPQDLVIRSRLLDKLSQALRHPLTLISAPAGYGKSVMASSFLQTCSLPSAWLSLDAQDDELRIFLDYVLSALDALFPGLLRHTQSLLAGTSLPPVAVITDSLIDELAALDREFILALDDVHVIQAADIYRLLAGLLRHPSQRLHLLLLTRQDPPLGLETLRARDQVSEIRARDLRFTVSEAATFLGQTVATPLSNEALAMLTEQTEGWAAGLRLAALTLRHGGDIDQLAARAHAENRYVMGYLVGEVLAHVPPEIEDFLVKTSILDTLCGALCDAVTEPEGATPRGQALLELFEDTNMFTVALDEQGHWYRYHHLFQTLLQGWLKRKLDAHEIDALHSRASAWYASHDDVEAAVQHALAGHDLLGAVQLVAQHRHRLLDTEQRPRLHRLLRVFPERAITQYPDLLLAKAWCTPPGRADYREVMAQVDQAQALIDQVTGEPERTRHLQGEIDALRSVAMGFAANNPQGVIAHATRALEAMPLAWYWARSSAWLQLAIAYQLAGQLERAYTILAAGQQEEMAVIDSPRVRITGAGGLIYWMAGDLYRLMQTGQTVVRVSRAANLHETLGWGHCFLATAYYQYNDLAAAEQQANIVQEQRYTCDPIAVAQSAFILAAIHQAHSRPAEARLILERANNYLVETHSETLLSSVQAFGAELAAVQGDSEKAGRWAATVGPHIPLGIMAFFYAPELALPRILLRMDTPASRQQAAAALARVHAFVIATHNTRFAIDVLALEALYAAAEGDEPAALRALAQAVTLAQPSGFLRVFVDLGPPMASLLERLARRSSAAGYIQQILDAFPAVQTTPPPALPSPHQLGAQTGLVEPLTNRELEVLSLLAQQLSAKEIAGRLMISKRTVSRHTANIYQKLGVNKQREAIAAAIALALLPARR